MTDKPSILDVLAQEFGEDLLATQPTCDGLPTAWISANRVLEVLRFLKEGISQPYKMLYDLTAIDERVRAHRSGQPEAHFTVVYHLLSFTRNEDIRIKVPLMGEHPSLASCVSIWPAANWYEREVWDMFGIRFEGHPHLQRILLPWTWDGHPLRKEHPARATEMGLFRLSEEKAIAEEEAHRFRPEEWGMVRNGEDADYMFLNFGPQHPSAHGVFRIMLSLDGEVIADAAPDIGYHHRGAEKMGERQSWHTYIPYTDRIDYLGGVMNNFPYVLAVEKLAGIEVPDRVKVIRVMMAEFFRLASHLVFYGTMVQDLGALSPVFFMFTDRERVFDVVEAVTGGRMHPMWFRIGGVSQDLPQGWDRLVREFIQYFAPRLHEYDKLLVENPLIKIRMQGVADYTTEEAIEWGVTGAGLRATGFSWDFRKERPYSGYDQFDFDIPVGVNGDCYDRMTVRVEEMRQSVRIIQQCLDNMPSGLYKAEHPLTTPPLKHRTMHDIETLITHFLGVSWGPVIPPGEAFFAVEATKGSTGYHLISDGSTMPYRVRIRTPSFPHLQMIPYVARGLMVPDLVAYLGSIDYVMADCDR
jgi:NADH-quinone oxidoreductase subunit C/D